MTKRQPTPPARPRFEVYQDEKSEWRWRLVSRNGRITAESGEGYKGKNKCQDAARALNVTASAAKKKGLWTIVPPKAPLITPIADMLKL